MKLGFCFLIYDILQHEDLWHAFFAEADCTTFAVYIHYKTQHPLRYFEHYKLRQCVTTEYCDVSIVHAHNLLFQAAYDDGCDKIISLSQACIPLKSFWHVYAFLAADSKGHFNITPPAHCFPRCQALLQFYPPDTIQKSANWFILNRAVCQAVLAVPNEVIHARFANIFTPEEHFFITTVFAEGLQHEVTLTNNQAETATTFTNWAEPAWPGMQYKYPSTCYLKNYATITPEELQYLINSPCLFGRKFNSECAPWLAPLKQIYKKTNTKHTKNTKNNSVCAQ